jgi:hypothetical protein
VIATSVTCRFIQCQVEAAVRCGDLTRVKGTVSNIFNVLALHIRFESDSKIGDTGLTEDLRGQLNASPVQGSEQPPPLRPVLAAAATVTVATIAFRVADFVLVIRSPDAELGTQAGFLCSIYLRTRPHRDPVAAFDGVIQRAPDRENTSDHAMQAAKRRS